MKNHDVLDLSDECGAENALFVELYKQKRRYVNSVDPSLHLFVSHHRQKEVQRQLDKITDLVRLVVQKMEIRTEIEADDSPRTDRTESLAKMQKFRQTLNVARRFSRARSGMSSLYENTDSGQ